MALGMSHLSRQWKAASIPLSHTHLLPQATAEFFLNPGSSEERLEHTEKKETGLGHCNNSMMLALHIQERKPTAWIWHWNHYREDVSLSSQDLGSPSVTQTARDSQGQSEPRQALGKDRDKKIINFGRALGAGNCVRRVECTAISGVHSGKFHTVSSGPGEVHILCLGYSSPLHAELKQP